MLQNFHRGRRRATAGAGLCLAAIGLTGALSAHAAEQELRVSGREHVVLRTFIGSVQVAEAPGSEYLIRVHTPRPGIVAEARREGREVVLRWPADVDTIHSPSAPDLGDWFMKAKAGYDGHRYVLRRGEADYTADVTVLVPRGARLVVDQAFGPVSATAVRAGLRLETGLGTVTVERSRGGLVVETGASDVVVRGHEGEVKAETGAGDVVFEGNSGQQSAETGSGDVRVKGGQGSVVAETGSGDVLVDGFAGDLSAETGSGSVAMSSLSQTRRVKADTGSGSVSLQGDLAALEALDVDTGSGSVSVQSATLPSLRLKVGTGSGDISVGGQARLERSGDDGEVILGAGANRGSIGTGSGDIRVTVGT